MNDTRTPCCPTPDTELIRPNSLVHNCRRGYSQRQNATASIAETQDTASIYNTNASAQTRRRPTHNTYSLRAKRDTNNLNIGFKTDLRRHIFDIKRTVCAQTTTLHQDMYIQWKHNNNGDSFCTTGGDRQRTSRLMRTKKQNDTVNSYHVLPVIVSWPQQQHTSIAMQSQLLPEH